MIDEIVDYFNKHGWEIINPDQYLNTKVKAKQKILAKCKCGEVVNYSYHQLKRNKTKTCKHCVMPSNKSNIEKIRKIIEDRGGELISETYINAHTPLKIKTADGEIVERSISSIKQCDYLLSYDKIKYVRKKSQRKTIDEIKSYFKQFGLTYVSGDYRNNNSKLLIKCGCGEEFTTSVAICNNSAYKLCPSCRHIERSKSCTNDLDDVKKIIEELGYKQLSEYKGHRYELKLLCKCGRITYKKYNAILYYDEAYCTKCRPWHTSKFEQEVCEYVKEIYSGKVIQNDRKLLKPFELDVVLPDLKLAIECNGIRWHSDTFNDKNKHIDKTKKCESIGYKLIHITDSEWILKKDIVKDIIAKRIGIIEKKYYARKCKIIEVPYKELKTFLEKNHLQGNVRSTYNYGLTYDGELISVATFGKSRFDKRDQFELYRFANKLGVSVIGAFSKLLKHFIKTTGNTNIVTYCDIAHFNGDIYEQNNFKLVRQSKPNYYYFKNNDYTVHSRNKFQKHKLSKLLENFDENLTEYENMRNNNYHRIWDCGNKVYIYNGEKNDTKSIQ